MRYRGRLAIVGLVVMLNGMFLDAQGILDMGGAFIALNGFALLVIASAPALAGAGRWVFKGY